jgi:uncharacterized small protein (DUF1192 family)
MIVSLLILLVALVACFVVDSRRPVERRELTPGRLARDAALPDPREDRRGAEEGTGFDVVVRGYRMDQVDARIDELRADIDRLTAEKEALAEAAEAYGLRRS